MNWEGDEYKLDDELVVFRKGCDELFILNHTARFIWEKWRSGLSYDEISSLYQEQFDIPPETANNDVLSTMGEWTARGLIGPITQSEVENGEVLASLPGLSDSDHTSSVEHYRLATVQFAIRYANSELHQTISPLFSHLIAPAPGDPSSLFDLYTINDGYALALDQPPIASDREIDGIAMILFSKVLLTVSEALNPMMTLHAGGVAKDAGSILLPGASGSGKSTLTAALVCSGYTYLGDDAIPIKRETGEAIPLPGRFNLKEGGRAVIEERFPHINEFSEFNCRGRRVFYLRPPERQLPGSRSSYPVNCLLFPEYRTGVRTTLTHISPVEALKRIVSTNSLLRKSSDRDHFLGVIEWIQNTPGYSLVYSSLDDATEIIGGLFADFESE
ncbi:PqqD family peptide modification chaperone [Solemya velum gill symbiont]|uniref:PqqD family peptide modification chaperone n=1 Tax=Solemya velum gill symbiont TaxID=2340 RepID=UPI000995F19F|nr:PqqD family peptide modification chaperone [Solemya velum gill symbiont]OOZ44760.1 hypothetical protein BOW37_05625 [Solemya velum gill symbiont]OOZ46886.1 hypothetical protein BOW38_05845 [Solemya velum gill symbiont]OOZ50589.1 hypothetical protein BOW39_02210 [Solemya velum gill symbiont]OOZ51834.1 hypothetical protein BOW40_05685 [Solemya velum gill symbiont]OOZ54376.1 hypothetical protein BOW41_06390 [Solemya velum gill symbiont]